MKKRIIMVLLATCFVMTGCATGTTESNESVPSGERNDTVSEALGNVTEMTTEMADALQNAAGALSSDVEEFATENSEEQASSEAEDVDIPVNSEHEYEDEKPEDKQEEQKPEDDEFDFSDFIDMNEAYSLSEDGTQLVFDLKYIAGLPHRWSYHIDAPTVISCVSEEYIYDGVTIKEPADAPVNTPSDKEIKDFEMGTGTAIIRVGGAGTWEAVFDGGKVGQTTIHFSFGPRTSDMPPVYECDVTVTVDENHKTTVDSITVK